MMIMYLVLNKVLMMSWMMIFSLWKKGFGRGSSSWHRIL